ncbi:MAG: hypothetical protein ACQESP_09670 [Candidatus Muiribacteriota bacterium]
MKKLIFLLMIFMLNFIVICLPLDELRVLGYESFEEEKKEESLQKERPGRQFEASLYDRGGYLSNSGLTGTITMPHAHILNTGEIGFGFSYSYRDGLVNFKNEVKDAAQTEKTAHISYGFNDNIELGFNFLDYSGEMSESSNQNLTLTTLNLKYAFVADGLNIALGGHYTGLTPKDQLMMTYSVLEKANSAFFSISEQISPFLKASFCLKSSFIRSIDDVSGFDSSSASFTTTSLGFDYSRIEGVHFLAELKKMNGDYVLSDNSFIINAGFRLKTNKVRTTLFAENIMNSSDKIYGYTVNYNF